jgi:hypothetical protein
MRFIVDQRKNLKFLISFVPGIIWWLFSFPARLSADSLMTIQQVRDNQWDVWHTLAYRLFVQISSIDGKYIFLTSLSQIVICTFSCLYFLKCIRIQSGKRVIYTAILMATPYGGGISSTLWKDSLSGSLLIFFSGALANLILSKRFQSRSEILKPLVLGIMFAQFRNENSMVLFLTAIILFSLAFTRCVKVKDTKNTLKSVAKIVAAAAVIGAVIFNSVSLLPGVIKLPASYKYLTVGSDLAFVSSTIKSKDAELARYVSNFSTGESYQGASYCGNIIAFAYFKGSNWNGLLGLDPSPYRKWLHITLKYPHLVLKHHYCNSLSFLPFPISAGPSYIYFLHNGIDQNSLNLESAPFLNIQSSGIKSLGTHVMALFSKYLWPGMLTSILSFFLMYRKRFIDEISIMILSIAYATSVVLFLGVGSQDFRYATGYSILIILYLLSNIFQNSKSKLMKIN